MDWLSCVVLALAAVLAAGCGTTAPKASVAAALLNDGADAGGLIIVAVQDRPEPRALPGGTPRADYRRAQGYAGSDSARALATDVARDHDLNEVSAWTIDALTLRCMLYRIPAGADRNAVLARLNSDPRVQLAQELNDFETLTTGPGYNDPYVELQHGFAAIDAASAQRWSGGEDVRVAVIDTGIDANHRDFGGRITTQRDFVGGVADRTEHHGTQVAGVIAAAANNQLGIVGVAPLVEVLSYRACWSTAPARGARCNSFTLAQALGAAIAAGADVINLSLGGPRDPLLERLAAHAIGRGAVVVGASGPGGPSDGFPGAVAGVLMVVAVEDATAGGDALVAPGRQILTLIPGGSYDFASGSSLAAAHVSGAVALLRSLDGSLRSAAIKQLLQPTSTNATLQAFDLCRAMRRLKPADGSCRSDPDR